MSHASATNRLVVSGPDALLTVVPHLVGFHPTDSLVLLGLAGTRGEVAVTMRLDLPRSDVPVLDVVEACVPLLEVLRASGSDAAVLAVYPGPDEDPWSAPWPHDLPRGELVSALAVVLEAAGFRAVDALCVSGRQLRSYWCESDHCCPPEGRPVATSRSLEVEAELVGMGSAPLESRAALESTLDPLPSDDAAVAEVRDELARRVTLPDEPVTVLVERTLAWLGAVRRDDTSVDVSAVVDVALACARIVSRDLLLRRLAVTLPREGLLAARGRLGAVVRLVPAEHVAPTASLLAVAAWLSGNGAQARVAVERALAVDPAYSLAGLLCAAIDDATPPWAWRDMLVDLDESDILEAATRPGLDQEDLLGLDDVGLLSDCELIERFPDLGDLGDDDDGADADDRPWADPGRDRGGRRAW